MDAYEVEGKIKELPKEVRDWQVFNYMFSEIRTFIDTCPLIKDLQSEAMRSRHWKDLRMEIKDDFDENGEDFDLDKIFSLNLLAYAEKIDDLTSNAKKQKKIEDELNEIMTMWTYDKKSDLNV